MGLKNIWINASKVFWHRHTEILKFFWWMMGRQTIVHNYVMLTHRSMIVLGHCTKAMVDYPMQETLELSMQEEMTLHLLIVTILSHRIIWKYLFD